MVRKAGRKDDLIAFDPDFKKDWMTVWSDISGLMNGDSAVDVQVPGVLKLVEVSSLVRKPVWLKESLEFLREISNHIKINSHASSDREREKFVGCATQRENQREREREWMRGLIYLIFIILKMLKFFFFQEIKNIVFSNLCPPWTSQLLGTTTGINAVLSLLH